MDDICTFFKLKFRLKFTGWERVRKQQRPVHRQTLLRRSTATNQGPTSICDPGNVDVILPAVWQVESDAPSYLVSKAHISYGAEADVEEGDNAHPQI